MYRNKQLTLDGVFGYNRLLVNGVDVAPTLNTNTQDISYIYNEALINTSNDILSTAKITEAVSSLTQTNTQDIKAIKTSLKENSYIQQGENINLNNNAKLQFPTTYPGNTPALNNAGLALYWNSMGDGETDLFCYGKTGLGGLTITTASNGKPRAQICKFLRNYIGFTFAPHFPTTGVIGNVGATTQYVNNVLGSYLTTANAASTYLSQSSASSIYQTISGMSEYLLGTTAALTYQPITLMNNYVTSIYASATFQTISNMSNYLTTSSASSIYQSISNMSNYLYKGGDIPFNINLAKFSFPSSFPTSAINNNNTGIGWFWNWSGGAGETDLICYGQASSGGLSIYGGGNTTNPNSSLICRLWPNNIHFTSTPTFPTTDVIGNYGATTQYVNDKLITQQASITNLSNQVSALQTTVQENNNTITNLSNQVSLNNETIFRLNSEINAIKRTFSL
jgi:hypothetical protein